MVISGSQSIRTREDHIIILFSVAITLTRDGLAIFGMLSILHRLFILHVSVPIGAYLTILASIWRRIVKVG